MSKAAPIILGGTVIAATIFATATSGIGFGGSGPSAPAESPLPYYTGPDNAPSCDSNCKSQDKQLKQWIDQSIQAASKKSSSDSRGSGTSSSSPRSQPSPSPTTTWTWHP